MATGQDAAALVDHGRGEGVLVGIDAYHVAHLASAALTVGLRLLPIPCLLAYSGEVRPTYPS